MSMLHANTSTTDAHKQSSLPDDWIEPVRRALDGLKFGSVVIIVQDGLVVQIDRTEKLRLDRKSS
jgi:hypothetical protein